MNDLFQALIAIPQLVKIITDAHIWLGNELEKAKMKEATLKASKKKNTSDLDNLFSKKEGPHV